MGAQGAASLNFGAFPGASDASVAVTGQAGIVAGSLVEAWLRLEASADHTADEHLVETLKVMAGNIVAGTGFTIYGVNSNQLNEPVMGPLHELHVQTGSATAILIKLAAPGVGRQGGGGRGTRLHGAWTIGWAWN